MDKQFLRILMLSVLLPAGANLAEAIDHERQAFFAHRHDLAVPLVSSLSENTTRPRAVDDRKFLEKVVAEEDAALRRHAR